MTLEEERTVRTINCTPTWEGILGLLLAGYTEGGLEAREAATEELRRMAQAADAYNAMVAEEASDD